MSRVYMVPANSFLYRSKATAREFVDSLADIGPDSGFGTVRWNAFVSTKAVYYTKDDIVTESATGDRGFIVFELPDSAMPWRLLFVTKGLLG